jgi:hypothetical protein
MQFVTLCVVGALELLRPELKLKKIIYAEDNNKKPNLPAGRQVGLVKPDIN